MAEITGRKQLIHLHGSDGSKLTEDKVNKGELAVLHTDGHAALATQENGGKLVYFVDSGTVATMIEQGAGTGLTALSAATVKIEGRVDTAETKIKTLEDTVGTAIDGYGTLCNEVDRLSKSATSVNTRLDTAESDIDNLESSRLKNVVVNGITGTVANNIATVTIDADDIQYSTTPTQTVKAKIDSLDNDIKSHESAITALKTRATNLEALHAAGSHNGKSTVAEEVTAGINTLNVAEAGGAGKYIKSISESNGIITAETGSTSEFDAAGEATAAKNAAIAAAAASAATLEGEISALETRVGTAETDINNLETLVGDTAVATQITNAIYALDATASSSTVTAGQGIQVAVKEVDGKITQVAVSGNYDAKYDAIGSASAACMSAATYADGLNAAMDTRVEKVETNLDGFAANEDVKTYVDEEIAKSVSSALRFQKTDTLANILALTTANTENGYVYNASTSGTIAADKAIDGKAIAVKPGDNIVAIVSSGSPKTLKWDKLAADIDLSTYATVEYVNTLSGNTYNAITGETKARQDADAALEALITSVQGSGITSIDVTNSADYITLSTAGTGNERTITIDDTMQAVASASASAKGLAEASDVKAYVDGQVANAIASAVSMDTALETKLVNGETSYNTFKKAGDAIRNNATHITNLSNAAIKGVSAGTLSNISMTVTAKDDNGLVKINATAVTGSVATAGDANKLATAGNVKTYVDTAVGNESARTDTAISNAKTELIGDMTGAIKTLGGLEDRIDDHDTAITALQNGRLTDVAVVDNTSATGVQKINVTSTTSGTVDSLNFTNIVIDCGTFD